MLDKYDCLEKLAAARTNEVVVTTMSVVMPWGKVSDHPLDFASANSAMGHAADFALGLALGQPDRRVVTLNGDGSMLMCLGTLVTIAQHPLKNYVLIITDNGAYEVTGNQSVPGAGRTCLAAMARAAGLEKVQTIATESELEAAIPRIFGEEGPLVFVLKMGKSSEPPPKPADPMKDRAWRLKRALEG
jgi:thiamine pyrophosphate-dependent acetolactate synthase large subunit-like protein